MQVKHIYWFCYYGPSEPSVRYRAVYPLRKLEQEHSISYDIVFPGYNIKSIFHFCRVYFSALLFRKPGSVIVLQKLHTSRIYSLALKVLLLFRKQHTLYDIDDADYLRFPSAQIKYFMKNCAACSAGSHSLAEYASAFNSNTLLLTSPINTHLHIKAARNTTFTIGWIGYYSGHRENLQQLLFPALVNLDFDIKLVLLGVNHEEHRQEISDFFLAHKNVIIDMPAHLDWHDESDIYSRVRQFDIGIAPLIDNEFNRAKSAFKLKQYFCCGVPALASPVGEHNYFLQDGQNGYFCKTPQDFRNKIELVRDLGTQDYEQLSDNALKSTTDFNLEHYCTTLLRFYENE